MGLDIAIDEPASFELLSPVSLDEAVGLSVKHGAKAAFLAGGCDLVDQLKHQWNRAHYVINLKSIPGLKRIHSGGGLLRIGALTTLGEMERHAEMKKLLPGLVASATRVATPQIRNSGTIGGNLLQDSRCPYYRGPWYCYRDGGIVCDARHGVNIEHAIFGGHRCYTVTPSDTAPMLVALDATAKVYGQKGQYELPVSDLFVPPQEDILVMHRLKAGEILTEVVVPIKEGRRSAFVKFAPRNAWDFAQASVAVAFTEQAGIVRDCRIVLGAVAPTPWRSRAAEQALEGRQLNEQNIESAARAAVEGAAPLEHNGFKIGLIKKLLREALTELSK